jgi:transposase-like protein
MNHLTTDLIQALVTKQDITAVFRSHLESAMNQLLETELTAFLEYDKYDRIGINSGNSRNRVCMVGHYIQLRNTN